MRIVKSGDLSDQTALRTDPRTMGSGRRLVIPAASRDALGIQNGGVVFTRLDHEQVSLESTASELGRIRPIITRAVPQEVSLVDELLRDRRGKGALERSA